MMPAANYQRISKLFANSLDERVNLKYF